MSLVERFKQLWARMHPRPLHEWYHVTFDDHRIQLRAEPPGRAAWSQGFTWDSIERVVFKSEGPYTSDGIYVYTSARPESYAIPTEADGGSELWAEILRRGLFDPDLAAEAVRSLSGAFAWPPYFE